MKFSMLFSVGFLVCAGQAFAKAPSMTPELLKKGEASYKTNCTICHGDTGEGNGPAGAALNPKARNFVSEKFKFGNKPDQVFKVVSNGSPNTSMAPFAHLPEEERWALTHYVLGFSKKK